MVTHLEPRGYVSELSTGLFSFYTNQVTLRRNDKILLYYPFIFYAFGGLLIYLSTWFFPGFWGKDQIYWSSIATFVVLGNFAHNFLSVWQIGRLDSFREWAKEYRFRGLTIWQIFILAYVFSFGLISLLPNGFDTFKPLTNFTFTEQAILFFLLAVNSHHTVAQSRGISISMSHKYVQDKSQISSLTQKEKIFHFILLLDSLVFLAPVLILDAKFSDDFMLVRNLLLLAAFIWLAKSYLKLSREESRIKLLFLVRYLYRFAFVIHPITAFFAFGFHGADASLVYWNSIEKDASPKKNYLKIEFAALFFVLGASYLFFYSKPLITSYFVKFILPGFFISHYIMEGFLYRMKNPITRKHISKII